MCSIHTMKHVVTDCKSTHTSASVDGSGTESFPDNGFTDVGSNKQGNTRPQSITFL